MKLLSLEFQFHFEVLISLVSISIEEINWLAKLSTADLLLPLINSSDYSYLTSSLDIRFVISLCLSYPLLNDDISIHITTKLIIQFISKLNPLFNVSRHFFLFLRLFILPVENLLKFDLVLKSCSSNIIQLNLELLILGFELRKINITKE